MMRRKIYNEVDRLGLWKIELLNRPVSEEIAKVKSLQMVGETERRFEHWRDDWEHILAVELPDLEEMLIDAEEASDKYRFRKAKQILTSVDKELLEIEERIDKITKEVDEWVRSGEESQTYIVILQAEYNDLKHTFLSHYPSFGKAASIIEAHFEKVDEQLIQYEEAHADGYYPKAEKILLETQKIVDTLKEKIETIPTLRMKLTSELPKKIAQLERDMDEMKKKGFTLERETIQKEINFIRKTIEEELTKVEMDKSESTDEKVKECNERIEALYNLFAKEAEAKRIVVEKHQELMMNVDKLQTSIIELKAEVQTVLERYRIDDKDLNSHINLEKRVEQLISQFETVSESIEKNDQSYTTMQHMLKEIEEKLQELQTLSDDYANMLKNLRKDELEAKETTDVLLRQLLQTKRLIQRYNLPGVPESYFASIEDAEEKVNEVEDKLNEAPLDIPAINYALKQALTSVESCLKFTEEMIETALLSEKLIQYGNRYKSSDPSLAKQLQEAEEAFRTYRYSEALEIAARAIEPIDPEALKKINVELDDVELAISIK